MSRNSWTREERCHKKSPCCTGDVPHDTDTSSLWSQLCEPHSSWEQCAIDVSLPRQCTSSNQIRPIPLPYRLPITVPLYLKWITYKRAQRPNLTSMTPLFKG